MPEDLCPNCGAWYDGNDEECPSCGADLWEDECDGCVCLNCGADLREALDDGENMCPECGIDIDAECEDD